VVRYEGQLTCTGDDGTSKRHTVYGRTRQDVRDKLETARERLDAGAPVRDAKRSVAEWLAQMTDSMQYPSNDSSCTVRTTDDDRQSGPPITATVRRHWNLNPTKASAGESLCGSPRKGMADGHCM
jgi:hypothetical protein